MATIGNSFLGLIDVYKQQGKNGDVLPVIEALSLLNPFMGDAHTMECNMGASHRNVIRTGLPSVTWGKLYQGVPQSKSTTMQVDDTTGMVEGRSQVDERLPEFTQGKGAQVRMREAGSFLESMAQEVGTNVWYSDTAGTPERFKGLGARYNALANSQVINGGGAGADNTSIWFVTHGANQTSMIFPEGTAAGVSRKDRGSQQVLDDLGNPYFAKVEEFRQHVGITVADWRFNARIANIDVSELRAGNIDIFALMRKAYYRLHGRRNQKFDNGMVSMGQLRIYANRDVIEALDAATTEDNKVLLKPTEVEGKEVLTYRGIAIRETDSLVNTESLVA